MPPVNERDLEWTETDRGRSHFKRKRLSGPASADGDPGLGCSLYELPPDGRAWPYHYHAGNAEAVYVLEGTGRLRLDGETYELETGDYVPFPTGPAGAHQVENEGDEPLRYLTISDMDEPDVTVYPDSGKLGVWAGAPPGGREGRSIAGFYRLDDDIDYWDGE